MGHIGGCLCLVSQTAAVPRSLDARPGTGLGYLCTFGRNNSVGEDPL